MAASLVVFDEFAEVDINQDGTVSVEELPELFARLKFKDKRGDGHMAKARKYMRRYDLDKSGGLDRSEFRQLLAYLQDRQEKAARKNTAGGRSGDDGDGARRRRREDSG